MTHYDADLIKRNIDAFRESMLTYSGERTILFDADNTLYLFSHHGTDADAAARCHNKGYFKNLPVFSEAPSVVENLQRFGLRVGIISAYSPGYAYEEKLQSFRYHFPTVWDNDLILVPANESKVNYIEDIKHTIVVDDYHGNINAIYEAGGVAIKKAYSNKRRPVPTIHNLIDIFPLLHNLGVF